MPQTGAIQRDIEKPQATDLGDYSKEVRYGRIIEVYDASFLTSASSANGPKYGQLKIIWLDGQDQVPEPVDFLTPGASWKTGSGITYMPMRDDIVATQKRAGGFPVVTGFPPFKWDEAAQKTVFKQDSFVGGTRPLFAGEILLKGASQSELYIKKDGTVDVQVADPSREEIVINPLNDAAEPVYTRPVGDASNKVLYFTLGNPTLLDGSPAMTGSSPTIAELTIPQNRVMSFTFSFNKQLQFMLPEDSDLMFIQSITVSSGGQEYPITPRDYSFGLSAVYTPMGDTRGDMFPVSTEKNSTLMVIDFNSSAFGSSAVVNIQLLLKLRAGSVRFNKAGDLYLDGRNIFLRASEGKATLALTSDGVAELRAATTTKLGNSYAGSVVCNNSGVELSSGILSNASVKETPVKDKLKLISYYFITDQLPLLSLAFVDGLWKFNGVSQSEYNNIDIEVKQDTKPIWFSATDGILSSDELNKILEVGYPSYAELKNG